jgi:hypothetical protein
VIKEVNIKKLSKSKLTEEDLKIDGYEEYLKKRAKFNILDQSINKLLANEYSGNLIDLVREMEESNLGERPKKPFISADEDEETDQEFEFVSPEFVTP